MLEQQRLSKWPWAVCSVLSAVHPLGYALYVALNAEEVAELEKLNEHLVAKNTGLLVCCAVGDAVSGLLPSEGVADLRHKMFTVITCRESSLVSV